MRKWAWIAFWVLGLTWGSSFMLIRISVQEINPFELVFIRVGIAAAGLLALARFQNIAIPSERRVLIPLLLIGIGNPALPFLLISWGETVIHSSTASILQSTTSLFTLVIAHFFFEDERMSPQRVGGMTLGFIGVVILFSSNVDGGRVLLDSLLGQLAVVGASLSYAVTVTYSKIQLKGKGVKPLAVATVSMISATVIMGIATFAAPLLGGPSPVWLTDVSTGAAASAIVLGVFNTLFAYAIFYFVIGSLGAARASMVTYVVPVVGLILGIVFLGEPFTANLFWGAVLIMAGIGFVNIPERFNIFSRARREAVVK
ncbi:MAG: DMT family transporter [Chloroflexota bacterium]